MRITHHRYIKLNGDQQMINTITMTIVIFNVRRFALPKTSMLVLRRVTETKRVSLKIAQNIYYPLLTIPGQRLLGPTIDLAVDGDVAEDDDDQRHRVEQGPAEHLVPVGERLALRDRHALVVRGHFRMGPQPEEVQLRGTTNRRSDPRTGQHDPRSAVNARDLQRLQNRIVPV